MGIMKMWAKKRPSWPFCGFFWENVDKNGAFVNISRLFKKWFPDFL